MSTVRRLALATVVATVAALTGLAGAAAAAAPPPPAAAPYTAAGGLTLSTSTVSPGGQVTASAAGFLPDDDVQILVGGTPATTVKSDAKGAVEAAFTVPDGVTGQVEVRALGLDPDRATRVLSASLTVVDGNADPARAGGAQAQGAAGGSDGGGRALEISLTVAALVVVGAVMVAVFVRRRRAG